jgi:hypothetical protein
VEYVGFVSSTNGFSRPWGVVRPKLNAAEILARLGGGFDGGRYRGAERLPVTFPDGPFLHGIAARHGDGSVAVLISNYVSGDMTWYTKDRANQQLEVQGVLTPEEIRAMEEALASEACRQKAAAAGLDITLPSLRDPRTLDQLEPNGAPNPALPPTVRTDLAAASGASQDAMAATEHSQHAQLNTRPEVVLAPEPRGTVPAGQPVVDRPDGSRYDARAFGGSVR